MPEPGRIGRGRLARVVDQLAAHGDDEKCEAVEPPRGQACHPVQSGVVHDECTFEIFGRRVPVEECLVGTLVEAIANTEGGAEAELRVFFLDSLAYGRRNAFIGRLLTRDAQLLISTQTPVTDRAVEDIRSVLTDPDRRAEIAEHNYELGRRHFSYEVLGQQLGGLLAA